MKNIILHETRRLFFFPEASDQYSVIGTGCRLEVNEECEKGMQALRSFMAAQVGEGARALCAVGPTRWLHACAVMFLGVCTGRQYEQVAEYIEDNVREAEDGFLDGNTPVVKLAREVLYGDNLGDR